MLSWYFSFFCLICIWYKSSFLWFFPVCIYFCSEGNAYLPSIVSYDKWAEFLFHGCLCCCPGHRVVDFGQILSFDSENVELCDPVALWLTGCHSDSVIVSGDPQRFYTREVEAALNLEGGAQRLFGNGIYIAVTLSPIWICVCCGLERWLEEVWWGGCFS